MSLDELMEEYSESLYSQFPLFNEYLEVINAYASYLLQVTEHLEEEITDIEDYEYEIDLVALLDICNEILSAMDISLVEKFNQMLINGTINLDDEQELGFSSMYIEDGKIAIEIDRRYSIEDILGLIHEFFHAIHIERFNNNLHNQEWYVFTEAIALVGELYALMYMHQNDILTEDLQKYSKKLMASILGHADTTLLTGLALEIYDKEQTISYDSIAHFVDLKEMPEEYKDLGILLEQLEDFTFHESATYIFGFPIAVLISSKMLEDSAYSKKFIALLSHIEDYPIPNLLNYLGLDEILKDEDYICDAMNFAYNIMSKMITKEELDIKRLLVEMRTL